MENEVSEVLQHGWNLASALVVIASAICAISKTPSPLAKAGRIYKIIELFALNIGRAKDEGKL